MWGKRFTSYLDPSLEPNLPYTYRVRSVLPEGELTSNSVTVTPEAGAPDVLISTGSRWKYLDDGSDQGTAWRAASFDDSAWASGVSQFGYGDAGDGVDQEEETVVGYGPDPTNKYITTYFRKAFYVSQPSAYQGSGVKLGIRLNRGDGAVIYLNGAELSRANLPTSGTIGYKTTALYGGFDDTWVVKRWRFTGDMTVELHAERDGTGSGRVYTIQVECQDNHGDSTRTSTEVSVPH